MIKINCRHFIASTFFILTAVFPLSVLATVTPTDLINSSFGNTCAFEDGIDDLANILQNNLCGNVLFNKKEIAQCSRMALTQYALCRYTSVLNNSKVFIDVSSTSDTQAGGNNNNPPMNYSPNITTSNDNDAQTPKRKIFNWF
jgi:hypothetical protein